MADILRQCSRGGITGLLQLKTELLNKETVRKFHHHDIYLTSIISTLGKKIVALFKGIIVVGERKC